MLKSEDFLKFGQLLNALLVDLNYQVTPSKARGMISKHIKTMRVFRLQLINKDKDTSQKLIASLPNILNNMIKIKKAIIFNQISLNSTKFPSFTFEYKQTIFDLVITQGKNRGEKFEVDTLNDLAGSLGTTKTSAVYHDLIKQMNKANPDFAKVEIIKVEKNNQSTKKKNIAFENLNAVIADFNLIDENLDHWYVSLKSKDGRTISSWPGAQTLFNTDGTIQTKSDAGIFLSAFGVDLNLVQQGFDERHNRRKIRPKLVVHKYNSLKIKKIFERVWGINYFYVRKTTTGWKVFWLDKRKLNSLINNLRVTRVIYPSKNSKQITIFCENNVEKYLVDIRNSAGGEIPNDIKIRLQT